MITPRLTGDFNVATPVLYNNGLLVTTENNGARLFQFSDDGIVNSEPVARNARLRPEMSTGVIVNDRLYCVNQFLCCLDLRGNLDELWRIRDSALGDYAAIVASDDHVLVVGKGTLLLLKADGTYQLIARQRVFKEDLPIYSHPALVGYRLYIRGETKLVALSI